MVLVSPVIPNPMKHIQRINLPFFSNQLMPFAGTCPNRIIIDDFAKKIKTKAL
jgi:hypothetical protein